jgi:hypothetical protein
MYIAIRQDLSIPQQVVQSCHAAIESCSSYHENPKEHPSVVVIGIKSEQMLMKFRDWVEMNDLKYKEFREPDRDNELTSIAVYPVVGDKRQVFRKFQLLK